MGFGSSTAWAETLTQFSLPPGWPMPTLTQRLQAPSMYDDGQATNSEPLMLRLLSSLRLQPSNSALRGPPWPEVRYPTLPWPTFCIRERGMVGGWGYG